MQREQAVPKPIDEYNMSRVLRSRTYTTAKFLIKVSDTIARIPRRSTLGYVMLSLFSI